MTSLEYDAPAAVAGRVERRVPPPGHPAAGRRGRRRSRPPAPGSPCSGRAREDLAAIGANLMDPRRRERVLETSLRTSRRALRDGPARHGRLEPPVWQADAVRVYLPATLPALRRLLDTGRAGRRAAAGVRRHRRRCGSGTPRATTRSSSTPPWPWRRPRPCGCSTPTRTRRAAGWSWSPRSPAVEPVPHVDRAAVRVTAAVPLRRRAGGARRRPGRRAGRDRSRRRGHRGRPRQRGRRVPGRAGRGPRAAVVRQPGDRPAAGAVLRGRRSAHGPGRRSSSVGGCGRPGLALGRVGGARRRAAGAAGAVGALPADDRRLTAEQLRDRVRASAASGWSGLTESRPGSRCRTSGSCGDLPALLGGTMRTRVWWRGPAAWRVDEQRLTERSTRSSPAAGPPPGSAPTAPPTSCSARCRSGCRGPPTCSPRCSAGGSRARRTPC